MGADSAAAAVAGRRPDVTLANVVAAIKAAVRIRVVAVKAKAAVMTAVVTNVHAPHRTRRHVPALVPSRTQRRAPPSARSRILTCASPPIRSYKATLIAPKWMEIACPQPKRAATSTAAPRPQGPINLRTKPAPAPHAKSPARIAAKKCLPCLMAISATIK